jgi:hypothetical protein
VNVIDENIVFSQRQRLTELKIRYKQIGFEIGRLGMKDRNDVIPLLHRLRDVTFFTRDHDYYHPALRHSAYCLVHLEVPPDQAAEYVRRFLGRSPFRTRKERMGKVVRVPPSKLSYWQIGSVKERTLSW